MVVAKARALFFAHREKALFQESSDQFWFRNINYRQAANMMQISKDAERARACTCPLRGGPDRVTSCLV